MSARTSIYSSIEAAMGSLDLTLESELTLFRNRYFQNHEQQNVNDDTHACGQPSVPHAAVVADLSSERESIEELPFAHHEDDTILDVPRQDNPPAEDLATEAARLLDVSLEELEDENPEELYESEVSTAHLEQDALGNDIPDGAIVPSKALLPSEAALANSATLETYTDPALDDYLESSEVLLKHLDTPTPRNQLDNSVSLKWFAWAAGATLALSLLAAFFLQNVFRTPDAPPEPVSTDDAPEVVSPKPDSNPSGVNSPDLSAKEFKQVKPGSLAELPTPERSPASQESTPSADSATVADSERSSQVDQARETDSATSPSTQRRYYVVTEYVDEASLESAKKLAPEAKLVNFDPAGTKIQLQQFSDESTARTAAAEFEQKGVSVEILATSAE